MFSPRISQIFSSYTRGRPQHQLPATGRGTSNSAFASAGKVGQSWTTQGFLDGWAIVGQHYPEFNIANCKITNCKR